MTALLQISGVQAAYGSAQALFDVNLSVQQGEFVTLLGRNGMGKTTTIKSIMSMLDASDVRGGDFVFAGQSIRGLPAYKIARLGIGLVPEQRQVFPNLTVLENLVATARHAKNLYETQPAKTTTASQAWTLPRVYALFPRLKEREKNLGANLSGGEQQMLAIGRALMTNPRLLILDEATEGLAPIVREEIWHCLAGLKQTGLSVLVIDKNVQALMRLADSHVVLEKGRTVWTGSTDSLRSEIAQDNSVLKSSLGI